MEYFNAKWATPESIDYEYEHEELGIVPSTCASWDDASRDIFLLISADLGPYVDPPPIPAGDLLALLTPVSRPQMLAALVDFEIITEAEAVGWLNGDLPAVVVTAIETLLPAQRLVATLRAKAQTDVLPSDPLVGALGAANEMGPEALIALFEHARDL